MLYVFHKNLSEDIIQGRPSYSMNLFFTDWDPTVAASHQCDQYVVKIAVEVALFLSAVHWRRGYDGPIGTDETLCFDTDASNDLYLRPASGPYRNSKIVKDSSEVYGWVSKSLGNYKWALLYGLGLTAEYTKRYKKIHRTESVLLWLQINQPDIPDVGFTRDVGLGMPEEFKDRSDPVRSYQDYMICMKADFLRWNFSSPPQWWLTKMAIRERICAPYALLAATNKKLLEQIKADQMLEKKRLRDISREGSAKIKSSHRKHS